MNYNRVAAILTALILMIMPLASLAENIEPYASHVFDVYSVQLCSDGSIKFSCSLVSVFPTIQVTKCVVQKKTQNSAGTVTWSTVQTIYNAASVSNKDWMNVTNSGYKSIMKSGTFRVVATFSAGGESRTATSNVRTFN